jgi:hypothetical protein
VQRDESLVFPVELELPERLVLAGRDWFRRPELHVTTFTPDDLAAALDVDAAVLLIAGTRYREQLTRTRSIRFDGRVARVQADGRSTIVAFCDVAGLDEVYRRLSRVVAQPLPLPPTHVTLYTAQPGMKGIGLSTAAQVAERATPLPVADAERLRRHLRAPPPR